MSQKIRKQVKTTRPTKAGMIRDWYVFDASKEPLGRLSTKIARVLVGKNRADYSADVDMGGMVVVINADKILLTGKKPEKKGYFWHTGRIGRLKYRSFADQMKKDSTVPIYKSVKGMLPKNRHQDVYLNQRLKIYSKDHNLPHKMIEAN